MTATQRLLADYEHLAFPEDDTATAAERRKRIADAKSELADLRRVNALLVTACEQAATGLLLIRGWPPRGTKGQIA